MTNIRIRFFASVVVVAFGLMLVACHRQETQVAVQPSADYTVQSAWTTEPVYDAGATVVCVRGRRGYYDHYRVFHPVVVVGGFEGYYDSDHRFVSSAPGIRIRVQSRAAGVAPTQVKQAPRPSSVVTVHSAPASAARPVQVARPPQVIRSAPPAAPRSSPVAQPSGGGGGGGRRK